MTNEKYQMKYGKCFPILRVQFFSVTLAVIKDVALNPIAIGFFGAQAEMSEASNIAHLIEQLSLRRHRRIIPQAKGL
jgi:hypothetical protein